MISVTFEHEGMADCPSLLQVDVAGDGSTTTNQNEYQMAEPCGYYICLIMMKDKRFSPKLYTTALTVLHVMFTVTFKCEGHATWPARLQVEL
jgi:hypothetical protein